MDELAPHQASIRDPFWSPRLETNARAAIFHQWRMLEQSRCIDNFRIAAGEKNGFREGWFFADSDAYKWLDAAARIYAAWPSEELEQQMDEFIALLARAQSDDGYLYTYNQIHFPGERWGNLMIEHELYCHGHLIEAGVSHREATGRETALALARKAADLLGRDFLHAGASQVCGHEEIELALLRLQRITGDARYLDLARAFLERRGRVRLFAPLILAQNARVEKRSREVLRQRKAYADAHPGQDEFQLPAGNYARAPATARLRWVLNALGGQYFQMHAPIRRQTVPVGHAVRFGYLETATAMLARRNGDTTLLPPMQQAWERMVTRRMYVTGGIGALPGLEGFGRDDELDPEYAYAETCAALASLFWNWEMTLLTADARYPDLFEWQLYNAAAVGMGLDGTSYLYNNPLACRGGVARRAWFAVPCCPSNLARTWATLEKYLYAHDKDNLWVHQYIGSKVSLDDGRRTAMLESELPWNGKVRLTLETDAKYTLHLRIPSWAGKVEVRLNGATIPVTPPARPRARSIAPASGYDPRVAWFLPLARTWSAGDIIDLEFEMPIVLRQAAPRLHRHRGQVALTRGPLVYCLESIDNPGLDLFSASIRTDTLRTETAPGLLGGIHVLRGETESSGPFTAIPYLLWANRGESQMAVWVKRKARRESP